MADSSILDGIILTHSNINQISELCLDLIFNKNQNHSLVINCQVEGLYKMRSFTFTSNNDITAYRFFFQQLQKMSYNYSVKIIIHHFTEQTNERIFDVFYKIEYDNEIYQLKKINKDNVSKYIGNLQIGYAVNSNNIHLTSFFNRTLIEATNLVNTELLEKKIYSFDIKSIILILEYKTIDLK